MRKLRQDNTGLETGICKVKCAQKNQLNFGLLLLILGVFVLIDISIAEAQRSSSRSLQSEQAINQVSSDLPIANLGALPDAEQDFRDYSNLNDGTDRRVSPDGFFILNSSRNDILNADQWGVYMGSTSSDPVTEWIELSVNPTSTLGSFQMQSVFVGEYDYGLSVIRFENVVVSAYQGETVVAETVPFSSQSDAEETNYPIDYSVFDGIEIDRFRVTFTNVSGTPLDAFNLVSFTIANASEESPDPETVLPTVVTSSAFNVDATTAEVGGTIENDGGANIIDRGIVWSTSEGFDPADGHKVEMENGGSSFSSTVDLLPFGTTIYYRAFATNSEGTAYGDEVSFQTDDELILTLTGQEGWRLLTTPAGVTLSAFLAPIWTQGEGITGVDAKFGTPNVYTWNLDSDYQDESDESSSWWLEVNDLTTTTLSAGQGLLVMVYEDDDVSTPGVTGRFDKNLPITGSEHASGVSPALNTNEQGWSLLGNPFGSPVSWDGLSRTNVSDAIYVWEPNSDAGDGGQPSSQDIGSWVTCSGGIGDFDGRIAPFQGFFVQNSGSSPSISFTQADKTGDTPTFYGKEVMREPLVRIEMSGRGMKNSTWLRFSQMGSLKENVEGDAWQLSPMSADYALLATEKPGAGLMDIGQFPLGEELEIPLHAEVTRTGSYTLNVTDLYSGGVQLFLNDLESSISLPIEEGLRYEFNINQAAKTPADPFSLLTGGDIRKQKERSARFIISTTKLDLTDSETPSWVNLHQNYPNPFNPTTQIPFELPETSHVHIEVFNMAGRRVATLVSGQVTAGSHSVDFDASSLSSGVYMYRLSTPEHILMRRMTLIK